MSSDLDIKNYNYFLEKYKNKSYNHIINDDMFNDLLNKFNNLQQTEIKSLYNVLIVLSIKKNTKLIEYINSKISNFKEVYYYNLRPYFKYLYINKDTSKLAILLNTFYKDNTYIFLLDYLKYLKHKKTSYYHLIKKMYLMESHIYDFDKINYSNFIDIIEISKINNLDIRYEINNRYAKRHILDNFSFLTYHNKPNYIHGVFYDFKLLFYYYDNLINLHNNFNETNINTEILDNYGYIDFDDGMPFDVFSNLFFYNYYKKIKNKNIESLDIYSDKFINLHIFLILIYSSIDEESNENLLEYNLNNIYNNSYVEFYNIKYKNILMQYLQLFWCDEYFENNLIYFKNLFTDVKNNLSNFINYDSKISINYNDDQEEFYDYNNHYTQTIMKNFAIDVYILKEKFIGYINNFKYIENPTLLQKYLCNLIMETNIQNIV